MTSLARTSRLLALSILCVLSASSASAASVVNFEDPPYIPGSIVGQDGWTSNSYGDNGNTFANANIVTGGALSGLQSLSIIGAVGADNFSTAHDVSHGLTDLFVDQGPGNDLELALLFRKGATGTGVFGLSEDGFNGGTPDFVLVSDTTIKAFGAGATITEIGSYVPDHLFEFILGFDLLGNTYDLRWRDVTANGSFTTPFLINQYFEGGGGFLGDSADPSILTDPDILLGGRNSGTNSFFDNVQLYAVPVPEPASLSVAFVGAAMLISRRRRGTSLRTMKPFPLFTIFATGLLTCGELHAAESDIVIADFEGKDYAGWKVEGTAFGGVPAPGTLPGQMHVEGFIGKGLANSFVGGDDTKGRLTSPEFTISRKFVGFRIGGGGWEGKTCMNLFVDGKAVRTATGPNTNSGGTEALAPQGWEVGELTGKRARIEIIDNATGGWGHINVDQIVLTDTKPPVAPKLLTNVSREMTVTKRWVNFPVKNGAKSRVVTVNVESKVERRIEAELADAEPEWWAPLDVSAWRGKAIVLTANQLPEGSRALEQITQSDDFPGAHDLYRERLRPQFHFSARRGWLNDPNGLAFFNGEYHLFFQHSPFSWGGTLKHWGQAVSRDLVHWEEIGDVLDPDDLGSMWSGSGVVDWKNTSGFGKDGKPPLVLFYTAAGPTFTQCIAYSTDGRAFTKYAGNPVLKQITDGNRDPKVIWHDPSQRWVMTLYVGHEIPASPGGKARRRDTIQFFTSTDLKRWTYASENDGYYECPDIFELPLDGDPTKRKWVLTAANTSYQIGGFDGKTFTPGTPILPGQRGNGMYAPQTFSDMPDARRVQIGWGTTPAPGMPFNQMMTFPCELTLRTTAGGPRMFWQPVKELDGLRARTHSLKSQPLKPGENNPLAKISGQFFDIRAELEPDNAARITFNIRGTELIYDAKKQELICRGKTAPLPTKNGRVRLEILVDRLSLEIFGNDGLVYMPMSMLPKDEDQSLALAAKEGTATIHSLEVHELRSIWHHATRPGNSTSGK